MTAYSVITKLLNKLKDNLSNDLQDKVDVLYLMNRISNDQYIDICDKQGLPNSSSNITIPSNTNTITDEFGNVYEQVINTDGTISLKLIESFTGELFQ